MTEETPLTREDALILLDELQEFLPRLEAGELDDETAVQAERLVQGLSQLPLPPEVLEDHEKEMGMWEELLLSARGEDRKDEGAPLSGQLEDRVLRLRGMVEEGVEP